MSTPVEKRGYTIAEASAYLGRSISYVRQLKRDSKLAPRRDGKVLIFLREDLDRYLEALPEHDTDAA